MEQKPNHVLAHGVMFILNCIASVMLVWAVLGHSPYSYYMALRWVCFFAFGFSAVYAFVFDLGYFCWIFAVITLVFNPFAPVHLSRDVWALIDTVSLMLVLSYTAITLGSSKKSNQKAPVSEDVRKSGWRRLGVVSSGVWILLAGALYFIGLGLYPSSLTSSLTDLYRWVENPDAPVPADAPSGFIAMFPEIDGVKFSLFVLCPVIAGWLVLYVVPASVRWVVDGFKNNQQ